MRTDNAVKISPFVCNGASNHCKEERQQEDYYATEPKATELLMELEKFSPNIWECACGEGHISEVLKKNGYSVYSSDLVNRGYGETLDFLKTDKIFEGDIITNPPYKYATEFTEKALSLIKSGHKVALFLKLTFLEGKKRKILFEKYPPKVVYVSSSRLVCAKNGNFNNAGNAIAYAWYIWEKGYKGDTIIKWFN